MPGMLASRSTSRNGFTPSASVRAFSAARSVFREGGLHSPPAQCLLEIPAVDVVVIDDEHRQTRQAQRFRLFGRGGADTKSRGRVKGAAMSHDALRPDSATHQPDQL